MIRVLNDYFVWPGECCSLLHDLNRIASLKTVPAMSARIIAKGDPRFQLTRSRRLCTMSSGSRKTAEVKTVKNIQTISSISNIIKYDVQKKRMSNIKSNPLRSSKQMLPASSRISCSKSSMPASRRSQLVWNGQM